MERSSASSLTAKQRPEEPPVPAMKLLAPETPAEFFLEQVERLMGDRVGGYQAGCPLPLKPA